MPSTEFTESGDVGILTSFHGIPLLAFGFPVDTGNAVTSFLDASNSQSLPVPAETTQHGSSSFPSAARRPIPLLSTITERTERTRTESSPVEERGYALPPVFRGAHTRSSSLPASFHAISYSLADQTNTLAEGQDEVETEVQHTTDIQLGSTHVRAANDSLSLPVSITVQPPTPNTSRLLVSHARSMSSPPVVAFSPSPTTIRERDSEKRSSTQSRPPSRISIKAIVLPRPDVRDLSPSLIPSSTDTRPSLVSSRFRRANRNRARFWHRTLWLGLLFWPLLWAAVLFRKRPSWEVEGETEARYWWRRCAVMAVMTGVGVLLGLAVMVDWRVQEGRL